MAALGEGYEIRHQAGKNSQQDVAEAYAAAGVESAQVTEFIDDVADAYAWADLLICRSGALTVSEVSAAGVGRFLFLSCIKIVSKHSTLII